MKKFLTIIIILWIDLLHSENLNQAKIHLRGLGNLRIGQSIKEIQKKYQISSNQSVVENDCIFYNIKGLDNVDLMFTGSSKTSLKLTRIYISNTKLSTISNIGIGDSLEKAKSTYKGKIKEEREHYNNTIRYIFIPSDSQDKNYGIIFDSDDEKITSISVGQYPELHLVEGCS
ncbi:hypothetical protein AB3N58_10325 [Leptospira sp. WS60.C2]